MQAPICAHVNSDALLSEIENMQSQALREKKQWHLQVNNLEQMEDGGVRRDKEEKRECFCETGASCRMQSNCRHVNQNFIVRPRNPSSSPVDASSVSTEMATSTDLSTDSWE